MTDAVVQWTLIKSVLSCLLLGEPLILYSNFKSNNAEEREVEDPSSDRETLCSSSPNV